MDAPKDDEIRERAIRRANRTEGEWIRVDAISNEIDESFRGEEGKRIVKEAIKEWLNEQFATFGKWSLSAIAAAVLGMLAYFVITSQGWHK